MATAAWVGICASNPPAVFVSFRRDRYTCANIMEKKAFTVNIPSENYIEETDYFGIKTGRKHDKLAGVGLIPVKSDMVDAPYIKEFPCVIECRLLNYVEIGSHTAFIGEILDVKIEEAMLGNGDIPDIERLKPLLLMPCSTSYYGIGKYLGKVYSIGESI